MSRRAAEHSERRGSFDNLEFLLHFNFQHCDAGLREILQLLLHLARSVAKFLPLLMS